MFGLWKESENNSSRYRENVLSAHKKVAANQKLQTRTLFLWDKCATTNIFLLKSSWAINWVKYLTIKTPGSLKPLQSPCRGCDVDTNKHQHTLALVTVPHLCKERFPLQGSGAWPEGTQHQHSQWVPAIIPLFGGTQLVLIRCKRAEKLYLALQMRREKHVSQPVAAGWSIIK